MKRQLVLGGPGSGKTQRLLSFIAESLSLGLKPDEIAFVSFTRSAVGEAKERFGFTGPGARHFRTLHSLCFNQMGVRRDQVVGPKELRAFGKEMGIRITGGWGDEIPTIEGDRLIFLIGLAQAKQLPLETIWEQDGEMDWKTLEWVAGSYRAYKKNLGLIDFADMLELYIQDGSPILDIKLAVVDEAQDLTRMQWQVVERAFANVPTLIIAGDDDQAIHEWAGADIEHFRNLNVDSTEVLPKSHRLPDEVFNLSAAVIQQVSNRYKKQWSSSGRQGVVEWVNEESDLEFGTDEWLLLARNKNQLKRFEESCYAQGVAFVSRTGSSVDSEDVKVIVSHERSRKGLAISSEENQNLTFFRGSGDPSSIWHEALVNMPLQKRAYYLTMMRKGKDLRSLPSVRIETIHSAKGKEANNVALITDISRKSLQGMEKHPDAELRVLYTGLTRTKNRLALIVPQTSTHFDLPTSSL
jgi:superfamily I DNA/RNA helicase